MIYYFPSAIALLFGSFLTEVRTGSSGTGVEHTTYTASYTTVPSEDFQKPPTTTAQINIGCKGPAGSDLLCCVKN